MREIKFRAWCSAQSRMFSKVIVGNLSDPDSDDYTAHCIYRDGNWYHVDHHDTGVHFMQYTGLKDKNGTELYSGDIYIKWGKAEVCDFESAMYEKMECTLTDGDFEIIGNIHQNPELLPC